MYIEIFRARTQFKTKVYYDFKSTKYLFRINKFTLQMKLKKNLTSSILQVEKEYEKTDLPHINVGDTVRVGIKIVEGKTERIQNYEGVVIGIKNFSIKKTILVRRIFQGFGMERIFVVHSPLITSIEIKRSAKVRRAKLYYLRKLSGKATRLKQKTS